MECRAQAGAGEGVPSCHKGATNVIDKTQETGLKHRQCLQGTGSRNRCGASAAQSRSRAARCNTLVLLTGLPKLGRQLRRNRALGRNADSQAPPPSFEESVCF